MPYTAADADKFKQGLSKKGKRRWATIANSALETCMEAGGNEKDCGARAVKIANSKFDEREPWNGIHGLRKLNANNFPRTAAERYCAGMPAGAVQIFMAIFERNEQAGPKRAADAAWAALHNAGWSKDREGNWMSQGTAKVNGKSFTFTKNTPKDPVDNHYHEAFYDENGNGATTVAGTPPHQHRIWDFRAQDFYHYDPDTRKEFISVHPGSLAFKGFGEVGECEMEIFRVGTHNGNEFNEEDLVEIAENFKLLKEEVRPKLKITHRDEQEKIGGLASYGDIVEVFLKRVDEGPQRLFARVINIPKEVLDFIKDRRFPERSIEIYPSFKLGTKPDAPTYNNVLKAIALLGHEMPAVTGMAPIALEECLECQGTACFREQVQVKAQTQKPKVDEKKLSDLAGRMKNFKSLIETEKEVIRQ